MSETFDGTVQWAHSQLENKKDRSVSYTIPVVIGAALIIALIIATVVSMKSQVPTVPQAVQVKRSPKVPTSTSQRSSQPKADVKSTKDRRGSSPIASESD